MNDVLLTGSADAVGARVLAALARRPEVSRIRVLQAASAASDLDGPGDTGVEIQALIGQLGRPRLGLSTEAFAELCSSVDTIVHCAERTDLDGDLQAARAHNVQPLDTLVEVLENNAECRLIHVSTTLIAGTKRGLFTEFDLVCGQEFYNAYDRSKFEAECLLRESSVSDRVTIVRRSLTLDELGRARRRPGAAETSPRSLLGLLLHRLEHSKLVLFAGDPRMHLDVVPLSYVAETIAILGTHPESAGKTVHCVATWGRSWPLAELVAAVRGHFRRGRVRFLPPVLSVFARLLRVLSLGLVTAFPGGLSGLHPYFSHRWCFDDFLAREFLAAESVIQPSREDCLAEFLGEENAAKPSPGETAGDGHEEHG